MPPARDDSGPPAERQVGDGVAGSTRAARTGSAAIGPPRRGSVVHVLQQLLGQDLDHPVGVLLPVRREPPHGPGDQAGRRQVREGGVDQAAAVVPLLRPGSGKNVRLADAALAEEVLHRPHRVDADHPHVRGAHLLAPEERVGDPEAHPNPSTLTSGRAAASAAVASPTPQPISTTRGASRSNQSPTRKPGSSVAASGIHHSSRRRSHASAWVTRPAPAAGVGQHLRQAAAVVRQPRVRSRGPHGLGHRQGSSR